MKLAHKGYYDAMQHMQCKDDKAILKDIDRTLPHLGFFDKNSKGHNILYRILKALSIYMKDVGYCQGINFLAATVYLSIEDEESTFWMLVHLLQEEKFKKIFSRGLKRYHLACYQLDYLVSVHLPQLHSFFVHYTLIIEKNKTQCQCLFFTMVFNFLMLWSLYGNCFKGYWLLLIGWLEDFI